MNKTEDQIQAEFYKTAYNRYPQIRGMLFSIPNGSTRHPLEAMKLKATGLTPGIPDMLLVWPVLTAFEFKTADGRLSKEQVHIHDIWAANWIVVNICRSAEEALLILDRILEKVA